MKPTVDRPYDDPEALDREKQLNAIAWGLFFLWVGAAWLAGIDWGLGLVVTGLIVLGAQLARRRFALGVEGFWVAIGILFVLSGTWQSFNVRIGLVPVVCLMAGVALLVSTLVRRRAR
ncbi:MAG TPA: hypothetical protein VI356_07350 [Myxococcales bacterium]